MKAIGELRCRNRRWQAPTLGWRLAIRNGCLLLSLLLLSTACGAGREALTGRREAGGQVLQQTAWTAGIVSGESNAPRAAPSLLTAVRTGEHEGFDRIVFEFAGRKIPGYQVAYVDHSVRLCGSGKPLYLPGDGWLSIRMAPARMHADGTATVADRDRVLNLPAVLRLTSTCDFEGIVTWVAAVSAPNRFRVTEMEAPARLVVDISR